MRKLFTANQFLFTLGVVFVFVLWIILSYSLGSGNLVFPNPVDTFASLFELMGRSYLWQSLLSSLLRTLQGFGISFALALILGSLAGEVKGLQAFFRPALVVLKSAPTAAFVFLFLVLSGSSVAPTWVVGMVSFPILYEAVVAGINAVPQEILDATRVDGAPAFRGLLYIKIPLATPYVAVGVLSSFALSFKTEIMAEIVTGSTSSGLGGMIRMLRNEDPTNLAPIFAVTVLAISVVLLLDLALFGVKKILPSSN